MIITNIKDNFIHLTNKEKKQLMEQFIDKIVVEKKDNQIGIVDLKFSV